MDNERKDSMVDWILQLDTAPYASGAATFPNPFPYTIPQDEPIVYTSPPQQQSLDVCSTQQQITMSHLVPYECTNHSTATNSYEGSGTNSIVTNPELSQLGEEKEYQQQDDFKDGERQLQLYCQQQQQYQSQYQQPNALISTMPTQQQQQPQAAPSSPSQDNSNKIASAAYLMPMKRLKKPRPKPKSSFSSTSPTSIHGTEPLSGRLDFRPTMTDQVPENQLKTMSPRERRQLRNKISARNFRNRRKEYMTTMEEELDTCKSENKKLHAELASLRDKTNKLETENKQLRMDLVLCKEDIRPGSTQQQQQAQNLHRQGNRSSSSSITDSQPPYTHLHHHHNLQQPPNETGDIMASNLTSSPGTLHALSSGSSASPPDLNILHDFPCQQTTGMIHQDPLHQQQQQQQHQYHTMQQQYHAYHQQQLQLIQQQQQQQQHQLQHQQCPPEMASSWNLPLPPDFNLHNMYLSHATMPEWDVNRLLSKAIEHSLAPPITNNISVTDTFQRFPLLAPALMSIVVGHTMTLSPNELMTLSTTNSAAAAAFQCSDTKGKRLGVYPTRSGFDDKRALKIWQLLQPLTRRKPSFSPPDNNSENDIGGTKAGNDDGDDGGNDDDKGKDDSLKATIASYAAYFEGKCVVTAYVLGQMSILHEFVMDETTTPTTTSDSRLSEIEDSSDDDGEDADADADDDDDDNQEDPQPRPSEILPLCSEFKRSKELYIPVS